MSRYETCGVSRANRLEYLRQNRRKIGRQWHMELQSNPCARMFERKLRRVQKLPLERPHHAFICRTANRILSAGAIRVVAYDRVPDVRQMYSNLMCAPGLYLDI